MVWTKKPWKNPKAIHGLANYQSLWNQQYRNLVLSVGYSHVLLVCDRLLASDTISAPDYPESTVVPEYHIKSKGIKVKYFRIFLIKDKVLEINHLEGGVTLLRKYPMKTFEFWSANQILPPTVMVLTLRLHCVRTVRLRTASRVLWRLTLGSNLFAATGSRA